MLRFGNVRTIGICLCLVLSVLSPPVAWGEDEIVALQESQPLVAKDNQIQGWSENIDFGQTLEYKLPLTLTFYNGSGAAPGYSWFRIAIPAMPVLTETNMADKKTLSIDMTGRFGRGNNQMIITGAGVKGATMSWRLTTPKMSVTELNPKIVGPGQTVVITGKNFAGDRTVDSVTFDGIAGEVESASPSQLNVIVPSNLKSGEAKVTVAVGRQVETETLKVTVSPAPTLTDTNWHSIANGANITIQGKNFSPVLTENKVTIGGMPAKILSGTTTQLEVVVPAELANPQYDVPIVVRIGEGPASNALKIMIQSRWF